MNTRIFSWLGKTFAIVSVVILTVSVFATVASALLMTVSLTSPVGGENWSGTQNITWTQTGGVPGDTVSVLYSSGGSYNTLISGVLKSDLSYAWNTTSIPDGTTYKIKILEVATGIEDASPANFTVDNTAPIFDIILGVDAGPVQTDIINIDVAETVPANESGVLSQEYGFSADATCDATDTINISFTSGTDFSIAGDHTDYLCVKATDNAGNIGYQQIGQLNTDNTAPQLTSATPYTLDGAEADAYFNPTAPDTVAIVMNANEPVTWTTVRIQDVATGLIQKDRHPAGVSATLNTTWDGTVSTGGPLVDGEYEIFYTITDIAGNVTGPIAGPLTPYRINVDTVAPTMTIVLGTTIQGAGDTITVTLDENVVPTDGDWTNGGEFTFESPIGTPVDLTGATYSFNSGTNVLTVTLGGSNTVNDHLKNGNLARVIPTVNAVKDLAGNALTVLKDMIVNGDTVAPTVGLTYDIDRQVKDADTVVITATFSEEMESAPTIAIATLGTGSLSATAMNPTTGDQKVWTYDWNVPAGSAEDGTATITIAGEDLAGNTMTDSTNTRTIDNTDPSIVLFTNPTAETVYRTNSILTFSATDNSSTEVCSYSLDAGATYTTMASCSETNAVVAGLAEGRNVIEVKIEDEAGNIILSGNPSFVYDTDAILTVDDTPANNPDFATIQGAIDEWVSGITTISVAGGTYTENPIVNQALTVTASGSTASTIIDGLVTITNPNVTLEKFTLTNPAGNNAVLITGVGGATVRDNTVNNVGTGAAGNIDAIVWLDGASDAIGLTVTGNTISNIGNTTTSGNASAISVSDSTGTTIVDEVIINDNLISNINAKANNGAYGILLNHSTSPVSGAGKAANVEIRNNTISGLTSDTTTGWATAVGLEGNTQYVQVLGNIISGLTAATTNGVHIKDNSFANTAAIRFNQFDVALSFGVLSDSTTDVGTAPFAEKNWWGDTTGPYNTAKNPIGAGADVSDYIDFSPFCTDPACTTFASVDPIASFDLVFAPASQIVNSNSTLTITAKDARHYLVVNDTTSSVNLSVVSGVATLGDLSLTMEADGDVTTTVTSNTVGTAGIRAIDASIPSANGDGTINFTAGSDITAPVISNIRAEYITTTSAIIRWTTNEMATDGVEYGLTYAYGSSTGVDATADNTDHGSTLSGLSSGTTYHYRIITKDATGNTTTSSDNMFTTASVDNTPPTITLIGQNPMTLTVGDTFTDPGATANDDVDGDISLSIVKTGTVNTAIAGTYTIAYNVSDSASNSAVQETRTVIVVDPAVAPVIPTVTLNGTAIVSSYTQTEANTRFVDGLEFNTTNTASFTINGSSVAVPPPIVTAKTLAEATALGLHVYNVVVTSSTGDTANVTVSYTVTADFDDTATLAVTGIDAVKTYATDDDTYANGWSWKYHITVPTSETQFQMKFSDFLSGANTILAGNNIRLYTTQASANSASTTAVTILTADTYSTAITLDADIEPTTPGRQIEVIVEMKVPTGSAGGSYSGSYGVKTN